VLPDSARWANPITALAVSRRLRSSEFMAWVLASAFLAGGAGLTAYQWPEVVTPVLQRMLPGRLPSQTLPGRLPLMPGEISLLGLALGVLLVLTVMGTVPQAALAVARERERQTLESLLLTEMSPAAILWGKLVEVLLTPALATVALLPLICLSFSLGGVSAGSLAATSGFLLVCHLLFGTASLAISCWCRRGGLAVVLAYVTVLILCGGTFLILSTQHRPGIPSPWWVDALFALNPAAALLDCVSPHIGVLIDSVELPFAVVASAVYVLASPLLFALGVAGLRYR
jgi:ABC-type transport system involved in multi-copper enzyme maturation permease subunit